MHRALKVVVMTATTMMYPGLPGAATAPAPPWRTMVAGPAAHIHYRVTHGEWSQEFEVRFDDDSLVTSAERDRSRRDGRFATVQRVGRDENRVPLVMRDLRLR